MESVIQTPSKGNALSRLHSIAHGVNGLIVEYATGRWFAVRKGGIRLGAPARPAAAAG